MDLTSDAFFQDPYPIYDSLRAGGAICEAASGGYVVSGYNEVLRAFSNGSLKNTPSRFSVLKASNAHTHEAADFALHALPFRDGEEHKSIRTACLRTMSAAMPPKSPHLSEIADQIVSKSDHDGKCELIKDLATPFTINAMCRWLDFDLDDGPQLAAWSESIFRLFAPLTNRDQLKQVNKDILAFRAYIEARMKNEHDGLLALLLEHSIQQGGNSQDAVDNAILIFMDGIDNVRYGAANAVMEIFKRPERLQELEGTPATIEQFVQESLRLQSPASIISRVAAEDTDIEGILVKAGTPIFLLLGSSNRDGKVFDRPNDFIPERRGKTPLLFGHGAHSCLGGSLAISMIGALIQSLVQHGYKHATDVSDAVFIKRFGHRWPETVSIWR